MDGKMKFGNQIEETVPEWRDKFLSYKELKKRLKTVPEWRDKFLPYKELKKRLKLVQPNKVRPAKWPRLDSGAAGEGMTAEEIDFIKLLEAELEKFNTFFVEKEEECIIRLKELQDRAAKAKDSIEEMIKIRKQIVDFHGEMVLLENYCALNYTRLVKILKRYDKRTGALIRLRFSQRVLQQPFFTTDLLYKLAKECETMLDCLFPTNKTADGGDACMPSTSGSTKNDSLLSVTKQLAEIELVESSYMKSIISALRVLKEIRSRSSAVSVFSLRLHQVGGLEDTWNKVPILEQVAK